MKHKKLKLILALMAGLGLTGLYAQESVNSTGGNAFSGSGTVSYSVGQDIYHSQAGINGSVAEGVQQPYEISVITEIEEAKGITLSISVYPNPATNYLSLEIKDFELSDLGFQLFDMQGKLLHNEKIVENQTTIAMNKYIPATYFIKVFQDNTELKTFKVIKK